MATCEPRTLCVAGYHPPMPKKTLKLFPTPADCESAFYDALERADLNLMMTVWADEPGIVCIHPQGSRLAGFTAIRGSFAEIFSHGVNAKVKVGELRKHEGQTLSIHSVYEMFTMPGRTEAISPVLATNVYVLTPHGWRMILHHASLSPQGTTVEEQGVQRILH
jgi:ketosteroid isomerase-like protein